MGKYPTTKLHSQTSGGMISRKREKEQKRLLLALCSFIAAHKVLDVTIAKILITCLKTES